MKARMRPSSMFWATWRNSAASDTTKAIHAAGRHRNAAARGYLWGLVFQMLVLGCHALLLRSLGLTDISIGALTSIVVVGSLATLLPSPGGIGFRDAAYVWALTRFGIAHGAALSFALLFDGVLLATSAIGFVVYVAAGGHVEPPESSRRLSF